MTFDVFGTSLTGRAAWIAGAILVVFVILIVQNPSILGWLLGLLVQQPH
jgi:hypothetical protein